MERQKTFHKQIISSWIRLLESWYLLCCYRLGWLNSGFCDCFVLWRSIYSESTTYQYIFRNQRTISESNNENDKNIQGAFGGISFTGLAEITKRYHSSHDLMKGLGICSSIQRNSSIWKLIKRMSHFYIACHEPHKLI